MENIIRIGIVTQVYDDRATVRVQFPDDDEEVSWEFPVLQRKTLKDKDYWLPDIGEHVVVVMLPYGQEQGFVIGAIYSDAEKPPEGTRDKRVIVFEDGTRIEYDRKQSKLTLNLQKDATISINNELILTSKTKNEEFQNGQTGMTSWTISGNIVLEGELLCTKNITSMGVVLAQGGLQTIPSGKKMMVDEMMDVFNTHTHIGDDGGTTSEPNQQVLGG
ncbi:phage baseplate assembly protein V [Desulfurobacterium sp.]